MSTRSKAKEKKSEAEAVEIANAEDKAKKVDQVEEGKEVKKDMGFATPVAPRGKVIQTKKGYTPGWNDPDEAFFKAPSPAGDFHADTPRPKPTGRISARERASASPSLPIEEMRSMKLNPAGPPPTSGFIGRPKNTKTDNNIEKMDETTTLLPPPPPPPAK